MKNIVFITVISLMMLGTAYGQMSFGLKGGVNYNSNGQVFDNVAMAAQDPDKAMGFHIGFYGKQEFEKWYIRPELFYTKTSSNYEIAQFDMQKLDLPVLVGVKFGSMFSVFGGPAVQYILDTKLEDITLSNVANDLTLGLNVGVGLQISNFGVDLRYERGLSQNEADFIGGTIDTRPDQIILSFSVKL